MEDPNMMTVTEAANEAGVTQGAIRIAIYRGKLSAVQHYGRQLVARHDFEQYRRTARKGRPGKSDGEKSAKSS